MTYSTNILPRPVDYDQTLVLAIELSNNLDPVQQRGHRS